MYVMMKRRYWYYTEIVYFLESLSCYYRNNSVFKRAQKCKASAVSELILLNINQKNRIMTLQVCLGGFLFLKGILCRCNLLFKTPIMYMLKIVTYPIIAIRGKMVFVPLK